MKNSHVVGVTALLVTWNHLHPCTACHTREETLSAEHADSLAEPSSKLFGQDDLEHHAATEIKGTAVVVQIDEVRREIAPELFISKEASYVAMGRQSTAERGAGVTEA